MSAVSVLKRLLAITLAHTSSLFFRIGQKVRAWQMEEANPGRRGDTWLKTEERLTVRWRLKWRHHVQHSDRGGCLPARVGRAWPGSCTVQIYWPLPQASDCGVQLDLDLQIPCDSPDWGFADRVSGGSVSG